MGQVFRPRANDFTVTILIGGLVLVVGGAVVFALLTFSPYATGVDRIVDQPVPFSHQHHVGSLGIDCRYCHSFVEQSPLAGVPPTETCMTCHSQLWTNAGMLAPVRQSLAQGEPLEWNRVHDLPDFVYFDHSIHINNGVGCETCHGRVDEMPLMWKAKPLSMEWCLDCHRNPAPHLRPHDKVFTMGWVAQNQEQLGQALMQQYQIRSGRRLMDCYLCHR